MGRGHIAIQDTHQMIFKIERVSFSDRGRILKDLRTPVKDFCTKLNYNIIKLFAVVYSYIRYLLTK